MSAIFLGTVIVCGFIVRCFSVIWPPAVWIQTSCRLLQMRRWHVEAVVARLPDLGLPCCTPLVESMLRTCLWCVLLRGSALGDVAATGTCILRMLALHGSTAASCRAFSMLVMMGLDGSSFSLEGKVLLCAVVAVAPLFPPTKASAGYMREWRAFRAQHGSVPVENSDSVGHALATRIRKARAKGVFNAAELAELDSKILAPAASQKQPAGAVAAAARVAQPRSAPTKTTPMPRGVRTTKVEFEKYGYTKGCIGCVNMQEGRDRRPHTAKCRERMMAEMGKDEQDRGRVAGANQRVDEELARRVQEEAEAQDKEVSCDKHQPASQPAPECEAHERAKDGEHVEVEMDDAEVNDDNDARAKSEKREGGDSSEDRDGKKRRIDGLKRSKKTEVSLREGLFFDPQQGAWCGMHALNNYCLKGRLVQQQECRDAARLVACRLTDARARDVEPISNHLDPLTGWLSIDVINVLGQANLGLHVEAARVSWPMACGASRTVRLWLTGTSGIGRSCSATLREMAGCTRTA